MSPNPTQQVTVQIMGQTYKLACPPASEAALQQAVAQVDAAMCHIRDAGQIKTRDRIAVLAAVNLAFEVVQNQTRASTLTPTSDAAAQPHRQDARVQMLLQRLDAALSPDGRLF